ncbi:MAG: SdrD B-like domain-containing protein [Zavarzinella sp.]
MNWFSQKATTHTKIDKTIRLALDLLENREVPSVSGTVFRDYNLNGAIDANEPGVSGVVITAFDSTGAAIETATTNAAGQYLLNTNLSDVRLSFAALPAFVRASRANNAAGSTIQFVDASTNPTNVNLGVNNVAQVVQGTPTLVVNSYVYDSARTGGAHIAQPVLQEIAYGANGSPVTTTDLATASQIGSTWGLSYQKSSDSVYASSFQKRHAGFGPNAAGTASTTGAVYRIARGSGNAVSVLIDLNNIPAGMIPAGSVAADFATGADPHPTTAEVDGGDWYHDTNSYDAVGKIALGDMDISDDGRTLYTVNLATRELIEIPINLDGSLDTTRTLRRTAIPLINPTGSGITSFNANDLRPFAIGVRDGAVFVGVTYTAQTSGVAADLRAFVYAFNPATGTFASYNQATSTFTADPLAPVVNLDLTYTRGTIDSGPPAAPGNWRAWSGTFAAQPGSDPIFVTNPQPWLTDIDFDNNAMILGLRDRYGDQGGYFTGNTDSNALDDTFVFIGGGDILRATPNGTGGWGSESNGTAGTVTTGGAGNGQGPGGGEFYFQDSFTTVSQEISTGGLAQVPGFPTVALTGINPVSAFSGGVFTFSNIDGTRISGGQIYLSDISTQANPPKFGNANGVGDLEAIIAPLNTRQIGNRVFDDLDGDGIQDANEPGIAGVVVQLFNGATLQNTVTTNAIGEYYFDDLPPNTALEVRIDTTQTALGGRNLSPTGAGTEDQLDSDATLTGTTAIAAVTTPVDGIVDHSIDFGFSPAGPTLTLGDLVFLDNNSNGIFDAGDAGVENVQVVLIDALTTNALATTTTAAGGLYQFANLAPGSYQVQLPAVNFLTGGALENFTSAPPIVANPDLDVDNDNNGVVSGTLGEAGGLVQSGTIFLTADGEPNTDGDADANTNLTLDFGFVPVPPPVPLTLGNQVWDDTNNDGLFNNAETGIQGVVLELLNSGGTPIGTATTDANGEYLFTNLSPGTYTVRLVSANFTTGNVLEGFTSSTGTIGSATGPFEGAASPDANLDVDSDDNGQISGNLLAGGFITSGPITLTSGGEPTDGTNPGDTNTTLDFGVYRNFSLGSTVFLDTNDNGLQDVGETGVPGVVVRLLDATATTEILQTTTNANGDYLFDHLPAGEYVVELAAANFNTGGVLFGFDSSTGGVGSPFEGANTPDPDLILTDGDDNGTTIGTLGSGGSIQSLPVTLGPTANAPTGEVGGLPAAAPDNQSNQTVDFGVVGTPGSSIAGRIFLDYNNNGVFDTVDVGIQNAEVVLTGGNLTGPITATSDVDGNYIFDNLQAGTYTLVQTQPATPANVDGLTIAGSSGGTVTPNQIAGITLPVFTDAIGYTFAEIPLTTLSGTVFLDDDNDGILNGTDTGIANVIVSLVGTSVSGTTVNLQATTDATGTYTFTNVLPGIYTLTETQPVGFLDGIDTNGTPAAATVTNDSLAGIDLRTINTPATGFNFAEIAPGSLSGTVFVDENTDGVLTTGETGIPGVSLQLTGTDDLGAVDLSTVTDANGEYSFTDLRPGTYTITQVQPPFFADGQETVGSLSGLNTTNDVISSITLPIGGAGTGYNFGEVAVPNVAIIQTFSQSSFRRGQNFTIRYQVTNNSTQIASNGTVQLNLGGLTFNSIVSSSNGLFDPTGAIWDLDDLAPGESAVLELSVFIPFEGVYTPTATVSGVTDELNLTDNTASATIIAAGDPPPVAPTGPVITSASQASMFTFLSSSLRNRR